MTNPVGPATFQHSLHHLGAGTAVHRWCRGRPRAAVVLQHGFGEYAERYVTDHARLVPRLVDAGFEVWAPDLWGHGRSPGRAGVLSLRRAVSDHLRTRELAADSCRPVLLMGHSLGGLVTAASVVHAPSAATAVALLSPALQRPVSPAVRRMLGAVATVAPQTPIPRRRRPVAELSRDPAVGQRASADPMMHDGQVPVLLAATALDQAAQVWARADSWSAPTLVLHGSADTYTDPAGSEEFVRRIASKDKTIQLIDGSYHELLNDYAADVVLGLLTDWLRDHTQDPR